MIFSSNILLSLYKKRFIIPLFILMVTSFTHLWNPIGFPTIHVDEGIYMLRAMHLLHQGNLEWNAQIYDHPFFGPILIAGILHTINYPYLVSPDLQESSSFELLYFVPRIMVGLFAVLDTFLIYAIAKMKYGRNVAIISSLLFALMPLTWLLRRIYLESLLLPFILGAVLIMVFLNYSSSMVQNRFLYLQFSPLRIGVHENILIVLSGILIGLAIFTKIPAITAVPLLIFFAYRYRKSLLHVGLFIIPVILIPLIWPLYALYNNEFDQWLEGITFQLNRNNDSILTALYDIFLIDPILLSMGFVGMTLAVIKKKDVFLILWVTPFILFFTFVVNYVIWFYLIPIIGILCISSGMLIEYLFKMILKIRIVSFLFLGIVVLMGLLSTVTLISTDVSSFQFNAMSYVGNRLVDEREINQSNIIPHEKPKYEVNKSQYNLFKFNDTAIYDIPTNESVSIVSSPIYSWIYKYIFNYSTTFSSYTENKDINTERVILVVDRYFRDFLVEGLFAKDSTHLSNLFDVVSDIKTSKIFRGIVSDYNLEHYPFTSMRYNFGGTPIEIRSNY